MSPTAVKPTQLEGQYWNKVKQARDSKTFNTNDVKWNKTAQREANDTFNTKEK